MSYSTGGTPAAERLERCHAESLVFGQERKRPGAAVELEQLIVGDVPVPAHTAAELEAGDDLLQILVREGAVVADDIERCSGLRARQRPHRANEVGHVPAIEEGPDVQHARTGILPLHDAQSFDARHDHVDALGGNLQTLDDLAA